MQTIPLLCYIYNVCACWGLHVDTFVGFIFGFLFISQYHNEFANIICLLLPNNLRNLQYIMHILTLHRMLVQKVNGSGEYVQEGDTIGPRPNLTATLRAIVQNGFDEFYTGMTATKLVNDINIACAGRPRFCRKLQDIITSQDLEEYKAEPRAPFNFSYDASSGYVVYTAPAPYGGPALAVFLGIVTGKYTYVYAEHSDLPFKYNSQV